MDAVVSVRSQAGVGSLDVDGHSVSRVSDSDVSEITDTNVRDVDGDVSAGVEAPDSDRDDVVNGDVVDSGSGILLTFQTSALGRSGISQTAIRGVDFGVSVSVHIFCSWFA